MPISYPGSGGIPLPLAQDHSLLLDICGKNYDIYLDPSMPRWIVIQQETKPSLSYRPLSRRYLVYAGLLGMTLATICVVWRNRNGG
jgi:hypothetical protein